MEKNIEDKQIIQLGFVVKDLDKTKKEVAQFLDVPIPPSVYSGEFNTTQTEYKGKLSPETSCHMCFFYFGNLQVEFIQPDNNCPSVWTDFLNEKGEGMHHIAFGVKDLPAHIESLEKKGFEMQQKGEYRKGNGRYAYFDASKSLKMFFELLESYGD